LDPLTFLRLAFIDADEAEELEYADALLAVVEAKAIQSGGTDPDSRFVASAAFKGYLFCTVDEERIYVPFHLVSVFPDGETIQALTNVAQTIRLDDRTAICLSGSATFLGREVPVSDLDFCEYYPSPLGEIGRRVLQKMDPSSERALVLLKLERDTFHHPWSELQVLCSNGQIEAAERLKFDYVWVVSAVGLIPASCVTLRVSETYSGPALGYSFVYQEAVLAPDGPPRQLFHRQELGEYLRFLERQVALYRHELDVEASLKNALKALKRALSLLLIIGAEQDEALRLKLEELIGFLQQEAVAGAVGRQRIEDLELMTPYLDPAYEPVFQKELQRLINQFRGRLPDPNASIHLNDQAAAYAIALDDAITDIFEAAGLSRSPE
jgi:hypothetical protein